MSLPPHSGYPYGAASFGAGPTPAPKGRKGPLILLLSGSALCVVAVVLTMVFIASSARAINDLQPIEADGADTAQLDSSVVYGLYGNGGSQCTVTAADGTEVEVISPTSYVEVNERRLFGMVAPAASGDYTITCSTSFPGYDVWFGPLVDGGDIGRMVAGVFVVVGMFIVGLPLAVGGAIWLAVRHSHNRRLHQAPPAAGAGAYPGI
ncbi:hypothetical protein [Actinomyces ruminicola]|uniref:hypothetical protein n=1 Tax=Actinomyces ruminicola TaxID=332524 RepID=UPI0011C70FBC|nr:hypothetical protein [Actinomyces ruminicola]